MSDLPHALIGDFIDAVVDDPERAAAMLTDRPELINARWIHDETVVHFLAVEGFAEGVAFLLRRGAAVDLPNAFGDSPLGDAAALGRTDIVAMLLTHGARPDGVPGSGDPPLLKAARTGNAMVVRLLLDAGADAHYCTDLGETVFDAVAEAPEGDRDALIALFAQYGVVRAVDGEDR